MALTRWRRFMDAYGVGGKSGVADHHSVEVCLCHSEERSDEESIYKYRCRWILRCAQNDILKISHPNFARSFFWTNGVTNSLTSHFICANSRMIVEFRYVYF